MRRWTLAKILEHSREEYASKMPYKFTGTLDKFVIHLGQSNVTAADQKIINDDNLRAEAARESI